MKIKVATFNVNSIKARINNVTKWLKANPIDILLLQEIKCIDEEFCYEQFFDLGYNSIVYGQKSYNGVAIISKFKPEDVIKGLPDFYEENHFSSKNYSEGENLDLFDQIKPSQQSRYIEAAFSINKKVVRVSSIYVPNGGGDKSDNLDITNSEKFKYKINFFKALRSRLKEVLNYDEISIFGGDFNVALENIDVFDPLNLDGQICFHPFEKENMRSIINLGLTDCYRVLNPKIPGFSWWDYRGNSWQYNKGMRIDYLLASPLAADKIISCNAEDKGVRDQEKASDHCPVVLEIEV